MHISFIYLSCFPLHSDEIWMTSDACGSEVCELLKQETVCFPPLCSVWHNLCTSSHRGPQSRSPAANRVDENLLAVTLLWFYTHYVCVSFIFIFFTCKLYFCGFLLLLRTENTCCWFDSIPHSFCTNQLLFFLLFLSVYVSVISSPAEATTEKEQRRVGEPADHAP